MTPNDNSYRDGFKPKTRLGRPLQKHHFRTVLYLPVDHRDWLNAQADTNHSSASAVVRSLIDNAMKGVNK